MKKQYNVIVDDADIRRVEDAVPGAKGGTALRIAALMYARQAAGGESSDTAADPSDNGEGGVS